MASRQSPSIKSRSPSRSHAQSETPTPIVDDHSPGKSRREDRSSDETDKTKKRDTLTSATSQSDIPSEELDRTRDVQLRQKASEICTFRVSLKRTESYPRVNPCMTFALPVDHPIRRIWEEVRKQACAWLTRQTLDWSFVGCVDFRRKDEVNKPVATLLILAEIGKDPSMETAEALHSHLKSSLQITDDSGLTGVVANLDIIIVHKRYRFCATTQLRPGLSISSDHPAYGTLGGFMRIVLRDRDPIIVGLTCRHVACPDTTEAIPFKIGGHLERPMHSPANKVYADALELYQNERLIVDDFDQWMRQRRQLMSDELIAQRLSPARRIAAEAVAPDPDRLVGHVFGSSGLRKRNGLLQDWALIWLKTGCEAHNDLKHDSAQRNARIQHRPAFPYAAFDIPRIQPGVGELEPGVPVHARGYMTPAAYGYCDGIKAAIQPESGLLLEEWQVTSDFGEGFIRPGDSGALAIDIKGRVVGMVHGGTVSDPLIGFPGCITPVQDLIDDICERLRVNLDLDVMAIEFDI